MLKMTSAFLALALLAGLFGGAVTPIDDNVEPELVAVGEDAEGAHNVGKNCRRWSYATTRWSVEFISARRTSRGTIVSHVHRPRGIWNMFYGSHVTRSTC